MNHIESDPTDESDNKDYDCVVCMGMLRYPVALECGHTMCLECGQQLIKKVCPLCRRRFRTLNKSLLLDIFMKAKFGQAYITRCEERKHIKLYYKSGRYGTLIDIILDTIQDGVHTNHDDPDESGMFYDKQTVIQYISQLEFPFKFNIDECKLCIENLLSESELVQVRNLLLINDSESICDTLEMYANTLDSETLLECIPPLTTFDNYPGIGEELTKRRKRNIVKPTETISQLEQSVTALILNEQIKI